jgi:hypothetical protein
VYDPRAPSSLLALAEYRKTAEASRLLRYATWRTRDPDEAKDLVADAMCRVCDPEDKPWDPSARTFYRHMRRVMDDAAIEQGRTGFKKYEIVDTEHEAFDKAIQPIPGPDMALQARRRLGWLREMWGTLLGRLRANDRLPLRIYELACAGQHDEPEEFARQLGVPVEAIYEAMRRLRYHGLLVRHEWEEKDKQRMAGLREQAERARKKERP